MEISSFQAMYVAELQELRDVEIQLAEALMHLAGVATNPALKNALAHHREETLKQQERLDSLLARHRSTQTHSDQAMQALVSETEKMLMMLKGNELRDAGIIASAQKLEHYEIAAYGTAAALAGQLDLREDQKILHQTLEEEKRADSLLTDLAKRQVNPGAVAAA